MRGMVSNAYARAVERTEEAGAAVLCVSVNKLNLLVKGHTTASKVFSMFSLMDS